MSLAIAFGARGSGTALAHFEPARNVINLTKLKGAGSLAHEWGHALDFFLGTNCGGRMFLSEGHCPGGRYPKTCAAAQELVGALAYRDCTDEEMYEIKKKDLESYKNRFVIPWFKRIRRDFDSASGITEGDKSKMDWIENNIFSFTTPEGLIDNINDVYKSVKGRIPPRDYRDNLQNSYRHYLFIKEVVDKYEQTGTFESKQKCKTDFYTNAIKLDGTRSKVYYQQRCEMFARAFESYIEDKVTKNNFKSQYLVHSTSSAIYEAMNMGSPYPTGEERQRFYVLFDRMFEVMREEVFGGKHFPAVWGKAYQNVGNDVYADIKANKINVAKAVAEGRVSRTDSAEKIQREVSKSAKPVDELANIKSSRDLRDYIARKVENMGVPNLSYQQLMNKLASSGTKCMETVVPVANRMGNSKAWGVNNGVLVINRAESDEKKVEAIIEAVTRLVMSKVGTGQKIDMVSEGVIFTLCKKNRIDVRTYCQSSVFDEICKSKESIKSYLEQVIKFSGNVGKLLGV